MSYIQNITKGKYSLTLPTLTDQDISPFAIDDKSRLLLSPKSPQFRDLYVTGIAAQSALGNNLLLTAAGTTSVDMNLLNEGQSYTRASIQVVPSGAISAGSFIFEQSNDNINFVPLCVIQEGVDLAEVKTTINANNTTRIYTANITSQYIRCRIASAIVGGTLQAFIKYSSGYADRPLGAVLTAAPTSSDNALVVVQSPNTAVGKEVYFTGAAGHSSLNANIIGGTANSTFAFDMSNGLFTSTPLAFTGSFTTQLIFTGVLTSGSIIFEGSNDNATYFTIPVVPESSASNRSIITSTISLTSSTSVAYSGNIKYKHFRCRISSALVGATVQAITVFHTRSVNTEGTVISDGTYVPAVVQSFTSPGKNQNALNVTLSPNTVQFSAFEMQGTADTVLNNNLLSNNASATNLSLTTVGATYNTATIQINGSVGITAGAYMFEASNDDVAYFSVPAVDLNTNSSVSGPITAVANSSSFYSVRTNFTYFRIKVSTAVVGGTLQAFARFLPSDTIPTISTPTDGNYSYIGATAQAALGNNILNAVAGTTALDLETLISGTSFKSASVQVVGSAGISAGAVVFEGSNDNVAFDSITVVDTVANKTVSGPISILASSNKYYVLDTLYRYVRLRVSTAFVGGSVGSFVSLSKSISSPVVKGAVYNATTPALTNGQTSDLQLNSSGNLKTEVSSLPSVLSTVNSSNVQLAAAGVFTGTIESVSGLDSVTLLVTSDQPYTVSLRQYMDLAGTKLVSTDTFTKIANQSLNEVVKLSTGFVQVVVTNTGLAAQTTFELQTLYGMLDVLPRTVTNKGNLKTAIEEAGVYTVGLPTLTSGDSGQFQLDRNSKLLTNSVIGGPQPVTEISGNITANLTSVGNSLIWGTSYVAQVNVTSLSGTLPTLDISIQESLDGAVTWKTVYTFPTITAIGVHRSPNIRKTGALLRYVETVSGTTPIIARTITRVDYSDSMVGGIYNLNPITLSDGQESVLQFDSSGKLKVASSNVSDAAQTSASISVVDAGTATNVTGYNGQNFVTGTPSPSGFVTFPTSSISTLRVQTTGTWVGTLQAEASLDNNVTYSPIVINQSGMHTFASNFNANILGTVNVAGYTHFRIRSTAWTSGTAVVSALASNNVGSVQVANNVSGGTAAYPVDKSGTIAVGGTPQTLLATNPSRGGWTIINTSASVLWINELGVPATGAAPSIPVSPGQEYVPAVTTLNSVSIFGPNTGQSFTAREWNGIPAAQSILNGGLTAMGPTTRATSLSVTTPSDNTVTGGFISSAIVTGSIVQTVVAANTARKYFEFQNTSSVDMRLGIGELPSATAGILLKSGGTYTTGVYLSSALIRVFSTLTGATFTYFEV
jgi:hypothetical protein